jgi:ribose-phosphate pyrophosphokinase
MINKERKEANKIESMELIGSVKGKTCIIIDDMIDTAGTLCEAAKLLKSEGADKVYAFATHGIFSGEAGNKI